MRTSPAQLIVVALVAALFGFAGAASHTCSDALTPAQSPMAQSPMAQSPMAQSSMALSPTTERAVAPAQAATPSTPTAQP